MSYSYVSTNAYRKCRFFIPVSTTSSLWFSLSLSLSIYLSIFSLVNYIIDGNNNNNNNYGNYIYVMDRFIESRCTINNATVDTRKCFTISSTPTPTPRSKYSFICKAFPSSIFFFCPHHPLSATIFVYIELLY